MRAAAVLLAAGLAVAEASANVPLPVPRPDTAVSALRQAARTLAAPAPPRATLVPPSAYAPGARAQAPDPVHGLCADPRLEGRLLDPVEGAGRCGIPLPVEITHILGVAFEPPMTLNCRTARATADWLERGPIRTAPDLLGAPLASIKIGGTYACRTRNHLGGRLSEHAAGNAVDVSAFRTTAGREVALVSDWRDGGAGEFLLQAWRAACGVFGTVLGPDHDAIHANHFHFDTASRTRGPHCR